MRPIILTILAAAVFAAPVARADEDTKTLQAIGMGRAIYLANCMQCHGPDARGAGLAEPNNGQVPTAPDLTAIALRDGGFNKVHVAAHIRYGIDKPRAWDVAKGEMPAWSQRTRKPRRSAWKRWAAGGAAAGRPSRAPSWVSSPAASRH
jgi:mono/diheme cytochrome c family protein